MTKKNILHITPHVGAGVGTVVLNYLSKVKDSHLFNHRIVCLDYANDNAKDIAKEVGFSLLSDMSKEKQVVLDLIAESDIVLVHWWNHPLLSDFLVRERMPTSRMIFWSHILGSPPPNNFTDKLLRYPDMFVFTTPLSYNTKEVQSLPYERKKYLRDVWSTGGLERIKFFKSKRHHGFNIGYVGNVDYAKMNPDFLDICNQVEIPNAKFIVVGGPNNKQLEKEANIRGIGEKFEFTGFVPEIIKWELLSSFDVFGYPLAPHHYGTCDQVLQESMALGVVPVVLANPMESYMVKDGITGIVAKDKEDYVKSLQRLYHNSELRHSLSKNAKEYATHTFSLEKMVDEWDNIFNEVLGIPKIIRKWEIGKQVKDISAKDVFLESLGDYGESFAAYCNAINDKEKKSAMRKIKKLSEFANWQSKTKSTVHQFSSFFPNDKHLSFWSKSMIGR